MHLDFLFKYFVSKHTVSYKYWLYDLKRPWKKTRISPRFSTDLPVFDTVAKKSSSFLDILHKTNRKHHVYNSAGELKRSAILVKLKLYYLQCNILKVMAVQYYFCKIFCYLISHFSNSWLNEENTNKKHSRDVFWR